jgi:hypothetical protein
VYWVLECNKRPSWIEEPAIYYTIYGKEKLKNPWLWICQFEFGLPINFSQCWIISIFIACFFLNLHLTDWTAWIEKTRLGQNILYIFKIINMRLHKEQNYSVSDIFQEKQPCLIFHKKRICILLQKCNQMRWNASELNCYIFQKTLYHSSSKIWRCQDYLNNKE